MATIYLYPRQDDESYRIAISCPSGNTSSSAYIDSDVMAQVDRVVPEPSDGYMWAGAWINDEGWELAEGEHISNGARFYADWEYIGEDPDNPGGDGLYCPDCGSSSYDGDYCPDCGYPNNTPGGDTTGCPSCGSSNYSGTICPDCGYPSFQSCPNCGNYYDGSQCHNCGYVAGSDYAVTYIFNAGSGTLNVPSSVVVEIGESYTLYSDMVTPPADYEFTGWMDEYMNSYSPDETLSNSGLGGGTVTLYAQYIYVGGGTPEDGWTTCDICGTNYQGETCPNCGGDPYYWGTCPNCGSPLTQSGYCSAGCGWSPDEPGPGPNYCPECGIEHDDPTDCPYYYGRCSVCGTGLTELESESGLCAEHGGPFVALVDGVEKTLTINDVVQGEDKPGLAFGGLVATDHFSTRDAGSTIRDVSRSYTSFYNLKFTFNPGEGSGGPSNNPYIYSYDLYSDANGESGAYPNSYLPEEVPVSSTEFLYWEGTDENGNKVTFSPGSDVSRSTRGYDLVAVYYTNTIKYDANGADSGDVPVDSNIYNVGDTVTVLGQGNLAKEGYVFSGWSVNPYNVYGDYQAGDTFTFQESVTLYAQWRQQYTSTVTYDANGGIGAPDTDYYYTYEPTPTYPNYVVSSIVPTRDGYIFTGWLLEVEAGYEYDFKSGVIYQPGETVLPIYEYAYSGPDFNFVAQWEEKSSSVTCYFDPVDSYGNGCWAYADTDDDTTLRAVTSDENGQLLIGEYTTVVPPRGGFYYFDDSGNAVSCDGIWIGPVTGKQYECYRSNETNWQCAITPDPEDLVDGAVFKAYYIYNYITVNYKNIVDDTFPSSQQLMIATGDMEGDRTKFYTPITSQIPKDPEGRRFLGWSYTIESSSIYQSSGEYRVSPGEFIRDLVRYITKETSIVDNALYAIWEDPVDGCNVQVKTISGWMQGKEVWKKTESGWVRGKGDVRVNTEEGWSHEA